MRSTLADRIESDFARLDEIAAQHARLGRARDLPGGIEVREDGTFVVEGNSGVYEIVDGACSCPDYTYRARRIGGLCKHRIAVELALAKAS